MMEYQGDVPVVQYEIATLQQKLHHMGMAGGWGGCGGVLIVWDYMPLHKKIHV